MPIDTTVEGDPNSIHATATWLRSRFQPALHYCGGQVFRARTNAEAGWRGAASNGFQAVMAKGGHAIDALHADAGTLGTALDTYADGLHTAQAGMARAREIAVQAGLTVVAGAIHEPGPAPAAPPFLSPALAQTHADAVADHQRQATAFADAQGEADRATAIHARSRNVLERALRELAGHRYELATDFTNGVAGSLIEAQRRILRKQADHLRAQADQFEDNYRHSAGGGDAARLNEQLRANAVLGAEDATSADEGLLARVAGRIPGVGVVIAAGGVGWDVAHGTSPTKAIVINGTSTGVAMATEAGVAALMPESLVAAAPALALAGPVAVGIFAGALAGVGVAEAWNHWAPKGAGQAIEEGLRLTGHDFVGGAESAWHSVVSVF
ncbi:MAG TPA: hypothetical protein VHV49_15650 [Pseudonocardiaceae bacterium]|nr:hypothetical protein [Pseudonocardiaceae bacterium]